MLRDIDVSSLPYALQVRPQSSFTVLGFSHTVTSPCWEIKRLPIDPTVPDWTLPIPSPIPVGLAGSFSDDTIPRLVIAAPWYLKESQLPLHFDLIHGSRVETERARGIRYKVVGSPGQDPPLQVEIISMFEFPEFRVSLEAAQVPGYFTIGASPLPHFESSEGRAPNERDHYRTFVYEPASEDGEVLMDTAGQERLDRDCDGPREGGLFREVRLSSLYKGSLLNVNCCVSGICAYRALFHGLDDGHWGTCLVRYPPE